MTRSPLSDYYASIRLSPVEHDIGSEAKFRSHVAKRRNLLETSLKIPFRAWNGAEVLEFGPGSGENVALLARLGARLTLVEPLDYLIEKAKTKFSELGLSESIKAFHHDTVENFETDREFDYVITEGFIHFLDDAPAAITKISAMVKEEGFLLVGAVHTAGTFIESVKRAYLAEMIRTCGDGTDASAVDCAKVLFLSAFEKINHSRGFESWIKDTVLNPLYVRSRMLDYPTVLASVPENFYLFSSWPNYLNLDDLTWHKTIKPRATVRQESLDSYYARFPSFLHSIPRKSQAEVSFVGVEEGKKIAKELDRCLGAMERAEDLIAPLRALSKALGGLPEARDAFDLVGDVVALFEQAKSARTKEEFSRIYRERKILSAAWGSPSHYYLFHRLD